MPWNRIRASTRIARGAFLRKEADIDIIPLLIERMSVDHEMVRTVE